MKKLGFLNVPTTSISNNFEYIHKSAQKYLQIFLPIILVLIIVRTFWIQNETSIIVVIVVGGALVAFVFMFHNPKEVISMKLGIYFNYSTSYNTLIINYSFIFSIPNSDQKGAKSSSFSFFHHIHGSLYLVCHL